MDDFLLHSLGKSLRSLELCGDSLDELLLPRSAPGADGAGVAPSQMGSRPPLSIPIVDLKVETERVLCFWSGLLAQTLGVRCVESRAVAARAEFLSHWLLELEQMPWAERCASEVIAQSRLVVATVEDAGSEPVREPIELGSVREVVSWARLLGYRVSVRSAYRWISEGRLASIGEEGAAAVIRLDDLLECCGRLGKIDVAQRVC
ncbi:DNA binding protein [Corynebacterium phage Colleen]|uniref:DNA binding protein n=3 Tax=Poushouvirus Poushou TaxID=2560396 RepID=A0A2Z4Q958_9CAUD|nr:hypothetical protein FDK28_gp52 [Corynebacterium phage Poushou]ASJ79011.1 hypothetical protein PBI_POUSHOU_52 [Corynebacterium phage Poushou]AWY06500.1 DNA binding protein [Corynebacterium phage TouchMeNot]QFG14801.1 DNA binding protein [Corynebacterium phage Colleen]UVT31938.1 DNA binding protein [Corynebacterium phage Arianna]